MNTVPRQRKQEKVRETESRLEDRSLRYQSVGFIWGSALRHESVTVVFAGGEALTRLTLLWTNYSSSSSSLFLLMHLRASVWRVLARCSSAGD